jgi:hypothetical protein
LFENDINVYAEERVVFPDLNLHRPVSMPRKKKKKEKKVIQDAPWSIVNQHEDEKVSRDWYKFRPEHKEAPKLQFQENLMGLDGVIIEIQTEGGDPTAANNTNLTLNPTDTQSVVQSQADDPIQQNSD